MKWLRRLFQGERDPWEEVWKHSQQQDKKCRELWAKRDVDGLITMLREGSGDIRMQVALFLGDLGDPRAKEALTAALNDKLGSVKKAAAMALASLGDRPDVVSDAASATGLFGTGPEEGRSVNEAALKERIVGAARDDPSLARKLQDIGVLDQGVREAIRQVTGGGLVIGGTQSGAELERPDVVLPEGPGKDAIQLRKKMCLEIASAIAQPGEDQEEIRQWLRDNIQTVIKALQ